ENPTEPYVESGQIFRVAIEHRLMHAETLAYMFHWLDYEVKRERSVAPQPPSGRRRNSADSSVRIPAGEATLGQNRNGDLFGWDNEFESHSVLVPEFTMDIFNVTNAQFLDFVMADGYRHRSLWTDEGWRWIQETGIQHPKFWISRGDHWMYRTMFEEIPLPLN